MTPEVTQPQPEPEYKQIGRTHLAIDRYIWTNKSSRFSFKSYTDIHKIKTQDNIGGYAMSVIKVGDTFYHYRSYGHDLFVYTSTDGINLQEVECVNPGGVLQDVYYHEPTGNIWFIYIRDGKLCLGATQNPSHLSHWITLDYQPAKIDTNHCLYIDENGFWIYGRQRGGWESGDKDRRGITVYHSAQATHGWKLYTTFDPADRWDLDTPDRTDYYQSHFRGEIGQVSTFFRRTDTPGETRPERMTGKLYPTLWYQGAPVDTERSLVPLFEFNDGNCQLYTGAMVQVGSDWYCYFKYRYGVHYSDESKNPPDEHWVGVIRNNRFGTWQQGVVESNTPPPIGWKAVHIEQTGTARIEALISDHGVRFSIPEGSELISYHFVG